ncbi:MAG: aminotransferase class I/II-fold pyridoxal phosphate-dependent enzyme [Patescibacteria group bacterium]
MKEKTDSVGLRVPYALAVYGIEEVEAVNRVLTDPSKISPGELVKEFENKIANVFGKKWAVMLNSGSSANLISLAVLDLPKGSEVITPALTFATTVAPIVQLGHIPVFADVEQETYQINISQIESLISPKTKALLIPSLIGNVPDMEKLRRLAEKYKLWFIEDSCDTLGAKFAKKPTGYYSDISTTSFYASHIITAAGGGGMACFRNAELAQKALVLSSWGRESTLFGAHEKSEDIEKRFKGAIADIKYDAKFIFSHIGYNFQSTEIGAAFGLEQLKRLEVFSKIRQNNFSNLRDFFNEYEEFFVLPKQHPDVETNWLAFPLTIKPNTTFTRHEITRFLEERNIQTRPVFTGNILRQPGFFGIEHRIVGGGCPVADNIMANSFLVGCHHGLEEKHLDYLKDSFRKFLSKLV